MEQITTFYYRTISLQEFIVLVKDKYHISEGDTSCLKRWLFPMKDHKILSLISCLAEEELVYDKFCNTLVDYVNNFSNIILYFHYNSQDDNFIHIKMMHYKTGMRRRAAGRRSSEARCRGRRPCPSPSGRAPPGARG